MSRFREKFKIDNFGPKNDQFSYFGENKKCL